MVGHNGSNRTKRCPKSSATSIGWRSRTLATIAERISHSHPALTVAGATRIQHHCGTCGDRDATVFSVPLYLLTCPGRYRTDLPGSAGRPFSATHFLGHCFRLIPASCSFASSAFPVPPLHTIGFPPIKQPLALEAAALAFGCPRKWGRKRRHFHVLLIC